MSIQYITSKSKKKNRKKRKITVILVYHSFIPKMKSYGNAAFIPIGKSSQKVIDYQIHSIQQAIEDFEIIIASGYDSKRIRKYVYSKYKNVDIRCVENINYENSGICESIRLAINNTKNKRTLIINGNYIVRPKDLEGLLREKKHIVTSSDGTLDIKVNLNKETKTIEHMSFGSLGDGWCEILNMEESSINDEFNKIINSGNFNNKIFYEVINHMIKKGIKILPYQGGESITKLSNATH